MKLSKLYIIANLSLLAGNTVAQDSLFAPPVSYPAGDNPISVFATDLNNDGYVDLAVANDNVDSISGNDVFVFLNDGMGAFHFDTNYIVFDHPQFVTGADFDSDGDFDLVVGKWSPDGPPPLDSVAILLNNGDGTFAEPEKYPSGGDGVTWIFTSDYDQDNDFDLAVVNRYSNNITILFNNGDGTFSFDSNIYGVGNWPLSIYAADFDQQNGVDLVVGRSFSNYLTILFNSGDGTFGTRLDIQLANSQPSVIAADFNGDGAWDIAASGNNNINIHEVTILLNSGDGTFHLDSNYHVGNLPHGLFAADFDKDGHIDLAVSNRDDNSMSILLNNGYGKFSLVGPYSTGSWPISVVGADFDGDTDIDLAVANYYSDNVSILYNLTYTPSDTLIIDLDIKPGSCPNPLNIKHKGMYAWTEDKETENPIAASMTSPYDTDKRGAVVPVAILGTEDFDVADIDVATVELEGVGPIRWNYEDVATPVDDTTACACTTLGPDGFDDLTLKFDRAAIIVALGEVHDGDVIPLTITGELNDGTPFEGTDCVVIIGDRETMDGDTDSEVTPEVELLGNHPNPFNPVTEISFSLPDAVHVKLEIFNVMGQKVATVVDRFMEAGKHTVQWDAASFSSGVYFYRLTASDFVETKKMMLLK